MVDRLDRTVSRDSEPSSRTALIGEQPSLFPKAGPLGLVPTDRRLELAITGVKVWRRVIVEIHSDHDPIQHADRGHPAISILALLPSRPQKAKNPQFPLRAFQFNLGNVLLSHTLARAVPSGLRGLTSVFGMGTGGSLSLQSPKTQ